MRHLLPSANEVVERLCFYTCLSVILFTGGVCLSACGDMSAQGSVCLSACWDTHPPGQTPVRAGTPGQIPPAAHGHCSGRYASYWNAFLFINFSQRGDNYHWRRPKGVAGDTCPLSVHFYQFHALFRKKWLKYKVCTPTFGVGTLLWEIMYPLLTNNNNLFAQPHLLHFPQRL